MARLRPRAGLQVRDPGVYGRTLHGPSGEGGEWDFEVAWKALQAPPITAGWITAVRRGHRRLHRGLDVGVPALVLRSGASQALTRTLSDESRRADVVLDVTDMTRLAPKLGADVTVVTIENGLHDLTLSAPEVRQLTLDTITSWLAERVVASERRPRSDRRPEVHGGMDAAVGGDDLAGDGP
jgi:hypothetical protein